LILAQLNISGSSRGLLATRVLAQIIPVVYYLIHLPPLANRLRLYDGLRCDCSAFQNVLEAQFLTTTLLLRLKART
jgi:hypothetical protein